MLLIYSEKKSSRFLYVAEFIFKMNLKVPYKLTDSTEEYMAHNGPCLNFSRSNELPGFWIFPEDLIFSTEIFEQSPKYYKQEDGLPQLFHNGVGDLGFDVFSAVFYLISRYEEYLPYIPDGHKRFQAEHSVAFKYGFLDKPLVNHWILILGNKLQEHYESFDYSKGEFKFISTVDIDNVYCYRGKGLVRTLGAFAKDLGKLDFITMKERFLTLMNKKDDPYDTFDYQYSLQEKHGFKSIYFILFSKYGQHDRNISMSSPSMKTYIKSVADLTEVGLHPSYASNEDPKVLENEINTLRKTLRNEVKKSRQHYLRLNLPYTYRQLMDNGIEEDYTLGYSHLVGFRASCCTPFYFYDLELELKTDLLLHPFAFLETCFTDQLRYSPERAWPVIKAAIDEVKSVGGVLITTWHNRTFSEHKPEWKGWNKLYEKMLDYIHS